jgi:hypothetical protein
MALSRAEKKFFLDRMNGTARKVGLGDLLLTSLSLPVATANPSAPVLGQVYFNSSASEIRLYNGSTWVAVVLA